MNIHVDSGLDDDARRRQLFAGDVFVYAPRASTRALVDFSRHLIEEAFAPLDPQRAQETLPVEGFVDIVSPLKPRFIHHPESWDLVRGVMADFGVDMDATYFDVPRMRVSTSGDYLSAGVGYKLHPHRDTWYSSPFAQVNWWLPIYPFEGDSGMAFHPRYWNEPVANTSRDFNQYEWNRVGRAEAARHITSDRRQQPKPTEDVELEPDVRVVCPVGGLIVFSGSQLHSTVPNTSGRTRFSIDFRTAHLGELSTGGGAPNLDGASTGTTLYEYRRGSDLEPLPDEVLRVHDPEPPDDRESLIYRPPASGR